MYRVGKVKKTTIVHDEHTCDTEISVYDPGIVFILFKSLSLCSSFPSL